MKDYNIKITDFGLSLRMPENTTSIQVGKAVGTSEYLAPECCIGIYSPASDMWALGILLCYLLGIVPPQISNEIEFKIDCGTKISDECKEFIEELLREKPEERLTAENALKHRWIVKGFGKSIQ